MILAGIDIGTNTLRLLVAEIAQGEIRELWSDRHITRLGQDLHRTGILSRQAQERSLNVLRAFVDAARQHGALSLRAIGTSALRNASNASEFINTVKRDTGIDVEIVSGEEEARLTLLGVVGALDMPDARGGIIHGPALVIDIGGGSTEIIMTRGSAAPYLASLPLGAVYLTERYISHDPPTDLELGCLRAVVCDELGRHDRELTPDPAGLFVGTAGTITTMAAMSQQMARYDPRKINQSVLTRETVDAMIRMLSSSSLAERKTIRGLEAGREDIILAGALIVQEIMRRFSYPSLLVSDWGLREGILFDLYKKAANSAAVGVNRSLPGA